MALVLPIMTGISGSIALGAVLYRHIRPKFPVKVNCWFCGYNTTVPFGNENCWDCPECDQYNGFAQDGDYNKPIPAQYNEHMNHPVTENQPKQKVGSGGQQPILCDVCNRNQLLKVKQLANFVPYNEATYSMEIDAYKHHLEQVYRLCQHCNQKVLEVLERQHEELGIVEKLAELSSSRMDLAEDSFSDAESSQWNSSLLQHLSPPWHVRLLRLNSLLVSMAITATAIYSLLKHSDLDLDPDLWLPRLATTYIHGVSRCSLVLVLFGLFTAILAIFLFGAQRVHTCDALSAFAWLLLLLLLSPPLRASAPLLLPSDLRLLRALASAVVFVATTFVLLCSRYERTSQRRITKYSKKQWLSDSVVLDASRSPGSRGAHLNTNQNQLTSLSPAPQPVSSSTPQSHHSSTHRSPAGSSSSRKGDKDSPEEKLETMSLGPPTRKRRKTPSVFSLHTPTSAVTSAEAPAAAPVAASDSRRRVLISPAKFSAATMAASRQGQSPFVFSNPQQPPQSTPVPMFGSLTEQNVNSRQRGGAGFPMEDDRASLFSVPRSQRRKDSDSESSESSRLSQSDSELQQNQVTSSEQLHSSSRVTRSQQAAAGSNHAKVTANSWVRSSELVDSDREEDMEIDGVGGVSPSAVSRRPRGRSSPWFGGCSWGGLVVAASLMLNVVLLLWYLGILRHLSVDRLTIAARSVLQNVGDWDGWRELYQQTIFLKDSAVNFYQKSVNYSEKV